MIWLAKLDAFALQFQEFAGLAAEFKCFKYAIEMAAGQNLVLKNWVV
jgi:hypothetical protein